MTAFIWFEKRKYWWIPVSWQGWAIICIYILYNIFALLRIFRQYPSWFWRANWFGQELVSVTILLLLVCWLTHKKAGKSGKR